MKLRIEIFCKKDYRDLTFDCTEGKIYSMTLDTNYRFFDAHINHLLRVLNDGYFKIVAPWRYLPKYREFTTELYSRIDKLTAYCEEYYLQLENEVELIK